MNNYITLDKRKNIKNVTDTIKLLNMSNTLKNKRTMVWENDDLQISIDKHIIRILIYGVEDLKRYSDLLSKDKMHE